MRRQWIAWIAVMVLSLVVPAGAQQKPPEKSAEKTSEKTSEKPAEKDR